MARVKHEKGGHFHRDLIKIALLDKIHTPGLNQSIVAAIADCARCKNFGGTHLHTLLQPITRHHPFKLLVGDYLSMPPRKGGYHTVGLYLDTFTQHVWGVQVQDSWHWQNNSQITRGYIADSRQPKFSCRTAERTSNPMKYDSVARSGAVDTM